MRAKVPPSRSNATHVVDKMLRNSWNIGYISMLLPQACIIQVLHSGLATMCHGVVHDSALCDKVALTAFMLYCLLGCTHWPAAEGHCGTPTRQSLTLTYRCPFPAQTSTLPSTQSNIKKKEYNVQ